MTNLEADKERIKSCMPFCMIAHICRYGEKCEQKHKSCLDCEFDEDIHECIEEVLSGHKEPIKLKQWEKDLISLFDERYSKNYSFSLFLSLNGLKEKGYFKGIIDTSMEIEYILKNCEVIDD